GTADPAVAFVDTRSAEAALRVESVTGLNELVETFAAVMENQGPPAEIERVIDGVARIGIAAATRESGFQRAHPGPAKGGEKIASEGQCARTARSDKRAGARLDAQTQNRRSAIRG